MLVPTLPTPAMNRRSKLKNEMSNHDAPPPMKNKQMKKKQLHMGRRLRQIKKRLSSSKSISKSSFKENEAEVEEHDGHLSQETSTTTSSTSSLGQTLLQEEDEEDAPPLIIDTTISMMATTLKPRVKSMFEEGEEDMMIMMPMMPSMPLPATPWSPSPTPTEADDTADDWGVFASIQDDDDDNNDNDNDTDTDNDEEEEHDSSPQYHNYISKSASVRSLSFTTKKTTTNPCFQPLARLPNFAATAGSE